MMKMSIFFHLILAILFSSFILLPEKVQAGTLPSPLDNVLLPNQTSKVVGTIEQQLAIVLSRTISTVSSTTNAANPAKNSIETNPSSRSQSQLNENHYPDPEHGLLGPCVVSSNLVDFFNDICLPIQYVFIINFFPFFTPCQRKQCCCTSQVTDRSQCWNDASTPCPGTMGHRRRRNV